MNAAAKQTPWRAEEVTHRRPANRGPRFATTEIDPVIEAGAVPTLSTRSFAWSTPTTKCWKLCVARDFDDEIEPEAGGNPATPGTSPSCAAIAKAERPHERPPYSAEPACGVSHWLRRQGRKPRAFRRANVRLSTGPWSASCRGRSIMDEKADDE
jgi:hypothetical protein